MTDDDDARMTLTTPGRQLYLFTRYQLVTGWWVLADPNGLTQVCKTSLFETGLGVRPQPSLVARLAAGGGV